MGIFISRRIHSHDVAGRVARLAACLILAAMSVEMAPPAHAAAVVLPVKTEATQAPAAKLTPNSAPARKTKKRQTPTEVPGLRSAYSNTYDNHDGSYTASVSSGPINYQPTAGGAWSPIDLTLSAISGGKGRVRASKTQVPIEVGAPDDTAGFVSANTGHGTISLSLAPGATPGKTGSKPVVGSGRASVSGLLPGVDLSVVPSTDGFGLFLVLASDPTDPTFTFTLNSPGLTPKLETDGSLSFVDKSGTIVATMPQPYAYDSTPNAELGGGRVSRDVSYSLASSGGKNLLTVQVNPAWLATAIYPVSVDPSVTVSGASATSDTFVDKAYPGDNFHNWADGGIHQIDVGYNGVTHNGVAEVCYPLIRFTLPAAVMGSTVASATLGVYPFHGWVTTAKSVDFYRATSPWNVSTVTYNSKPSTTGITSQAFAEGTMSSANVTSTVQDWASGDPNYGFLLAASKNNDTTYWKRLYSTGHGGNQVPQLAIVYNLPVVTAVTPTGGAWTSSRVLDWDLSDVSGKTQTKYNVVVANNSSFTSPIVSTGAVSGVNTNFAIPGSVSLSNIGTYYWKVQGFNGLDWSNWASSSFRWDGTAPTWNGFTATSLVDRSTTSYAFTWNAASGSSAIASYAVQLQSAPISTTTANTCGTSWENVDSPDFPASVTTTTYNATSLASGTCYRIGVSAKNTTGNVGSVNYSSPVLVDTSAPAAPVVLDDATAIPNPYSSGYTIYFRPSALRPITLTSKGFDSVSDIASSTFGALSPSTGWTYTQGTVPGNSATKTITPTANAVQTTLAVTTTNNAGLVSAPTTITFVPVTGSTGDFSTPDEGVTTIVTPTAGLSVAWAEVPATGGITSRSLQRQVQPVGSDGLCAGTAWTNDGTPTTTGSPLAVAGGTLADGSCYHWVLSLTDSTGTRTFTSGAVAADGTTPSASIDYPQAGRPLAGSVVVTGKASDSHLSSYVLAYGAGAAPTAWTTFASSTVGVASIGSLALWPAGSLSGVNTLRLTATDFAGNVATSTNVVYLDNTERGDDSYNTKVPYDLGGGWNLGVNVATGEASLERDLFSIPSYGPAQSLSLSYNSSLAGGAGMFGTGWSSNLTQYLDVSNLAAGFLVWHRADGGTVPFGQVAGTWTALAGHYETLATNTGGYKITATDRSSTSFDATGRLAAVSDRFGISLTLDWTSAPATATDASHRATTIAIDTANSRITRVTDSATRQWNFSYTGPNLTGITDPAGKVTTLSYVSNQLTGISRQRTPASGPAETIAWSLAYTGGKVTSVTDPIGGHATPVASSAFAYGAGTTTGRNLRDASNLGAPVFNTSTYLFDSHGWVSWASDPNGWARTTTYDANGNALTSSQQVDSSTWATTTQTYDSAGNVLTSQDPVGAVTVFTYNADNDVLTLTGAHGTSYALTTAYVYDQLGHLCRKVENPTMTSNPIDCTNLLDGDPDEDEVEQNVDEQYTYTPNNQRATAKDPLGIVTAYDYDTNGNQKSVSRNDVAGQHDDSTSVTTTWTYDSGTVAGKAGLPASQTAPVTTVGTGVVRTTSYTYDAFGRVTSQSQPGDDNTAGEKTISTYDEFGDSLTNTV